ncbi:putative DCC family thiol-disulfide oxidoreductase YuxK [Fontibacillus phaseoli]|uniref:Putative DCC family thiol-disulfide oxidoreductase YuxK n=1 Tax=Fontibacillus phaseoli TaxID=1416533 RepID=A0A369BL57_9BACL|nr:DCC1-like thiol-disulfide oxidoreductase family protein [Fontibacillus phaseoli]RCX20434.1 putative DCC family thiol-disulfide oxidoreductase YuxK [Fontibacillus phaseoli]
MGSEKSEAQAVVLFDGVCHLCQGAVKFMIAQDPRGVFHFASLQSSAARRLLGGKIPEAGQLSTIVLVEDGSYYTRSTAALRIARKLRFPWPILYILIWIPPIIRNAVYDWIAARRYRWFGRDEACMVPTPEIRKRFLED